MHLILWEFRTREGREKEFEEVYGSGGDWARLFQEDGEFLGTELFCDLDDPGRYVTLDRWVSRASYEAFRQRWRAEYETLDARCESLTRSEALLGCFLAPGPDAEK